MLSTVDLRSGLMFNAASLVIGVLAFLGALVAFIPLLGWANWLLIPVALVGLVIGVMSKSTAGRNLNIVVLIVCAVRLMIGGGII